MSRRILTRTATAVAATATAGAMLLASPGLAQAATYDQGHSESERHVTNGTGDADARAAANDAGRINLYTEADGGSTTGLLGNVTSNPTVGSAVGSLSKRIPAASGTYRVVFTYRGLQGTERDRGDNGNAEVNRSSIVKFVAQSGGKDAHVSRVQQLPTDKKTVTTVLLLKVPNNSSGYLRVKSILRAVSRADGSNNHAKATAHVSDISFRVNRL